MTSLTSITGTQTISAEPTLPAEVGNYSLIVVACVTANPTSCAQCSLEVSVSITKPYFRDLTSIFNIKYSESWNYSLPTPIDPSGTTV